MGEIFANHISDKGLTSKIYIEPIPSIAKKQITHLKMGKGPE